MPYGQIWIDIWEGFKKEVCNEEVCIHWQKCHAYDTQNCYFYVLYRNRILKQRRESKGRVTNSV